MVEILQNKNAATRFQVMVEIAASGPNIQQRRIAAKLGVSPQAVSDYVRQLASEGMLDAAGRSSYRVTVRGVNWMLKMLREVNDYADEAARAVTNITVCAAVAETRLEAGQAVGLKMKDGVLYATGSLEHSARGVAVGAAEPGEDVGISGIEGVVEIARGRIAILEVPGVQQGGSRNVDTVVLRSRLTGDRQVGAIGIEAGVALRRAGIEPRYVFGVADAAIEAVRCGQSFLIVCTSDAIAGVIKRLQDGNLDYEVTPASKREA